MGAAATQTNTADKTTGFPMGLCAAGIIATSLGLVAAAMGVRWRGAPSHGSAFDAAWMYVNGMLMLTWLVLWPAIAFAPRVTERVLLRDAAAIAVAAIPAMCVASFLSGVGTLQALNMLALQGAAGCFTLGVLTAGNSGKSRQVFAAGLLAMLAVVGPVGAYLWAEFFTAFWEGWFAAVPLIAVSRTAQENTFPGGLLWGVVGAYAAAGVALLIIFRRLPSVK